MQHWTGLSSAARELWDLILIWKDVDTTLPHSPSLPRVKSRRGRGTCYIRIPVDVALSKQDQTGQAGKGVTLLYLAVGEGPWGYLASGIGLSEMGPVEGIGTSCLVNKCRL